MNDSVRSWRIGVDIGGTFTDLVLADESGRVQVFKVPTVPADPAQGAFDAVSAAAAGVGCTVPELLGRTALFVHGSTIATNTVLERSGARVGMLVTDGFRDALEIRRGLRDNPWDHRLPYPPVLVPRALRRPVAERIDRHGREARAVSADDIRARRTEFRKAGVEAVVIAFSTAISILRTKRRPRGRWRVAGRPHGSPARRTIAPVMGEYERTSTAVLNAYITPRTVTYLQNLNRRLLDLGLAASAAPDPEQRRRHLGRSGRDAAGDAAALRPGRRRGRARLLQSRDRVERPGVDGDRRHQLRRAADERRRHRVYRPAQTSAATTSSRARSTCTRSAPAAARSPMSSKAC